MKESWRTIGLELKGNIWTNTCASATLTLIAFYRRRNEKDEKIAKLEVIDRHIFTIEKMYIYIYFRRRLPMQKSWLERWKSIMRGIH